MEEPLTEEELTFGVKTAVANNELFPVIVGSATADMGVSLLLDMVCDYFQPSCERGKKKGTNPKTNAEVVRTYSDSEPFPAYIFKTLVDPFLGSLNFFKVISGTTSNLTEAYVPNLDQTVKLGAIIVLSGKNQISVDCLHAGDIGVITKTAELATGYTLSDKKEVVFYEPVEVPTPVLYVAIKAKTKQLEEILKLLNY